MRLELMNPLPKPVVIFSRVLRKNRAVHLGQLDPGPENVLGRVSVEGNIGAFVPRAKGRESSVHPHEGAEGLKAYCVRGTINRWSMWTAGRWPLPKRS